MLDFLTLDDVDISDKRVLIREDFNVPIKNSIVQNNARIKAAIPGIKQALSRSAQVILMSHKGRPEKSRQKEYSLEPIAKALEDLVNHPVTFIKDWPPCRTSDKLVLLENVRFIQGETENNPEIAKIFAGLCDVFVMDAFASAHRAHASTVGVVDFVQYAVAGPCLVAEISALDKIMQDPKKPLLAIIGGAKISGKLPILKNLIQKVNTLVVGGGMANTILAARGYAVGSSLFEFNLLDEARDLIQACAHNDCKIILPTDVVTQHGIKNLQDIEAQDQILDIGNQTIKEFAQQIQQAATILWNGPMGLYEDPKYTRGTQEIIRAIATSEAFSVAGGGETVAAIEELGKTEDFSHISTGGGAFLEYLEGKVLPAIAALIKKRETNAATN